MTYLFESTESNGVLFAYNDVQEQVQNGGQPRLIEGEFVPRRRPVTGGEISDRVPPHPDGRTGPRGTTLIGVPKDLHQNGGIDT